MGSFCQIVIGDQGWDLVVFFFVQSEISESTIRLENTEFFEVAVVGALGLGSAAVDAVLFRTLADAAPLMIWLSGPGQALTFVNKRWLDFVGRTMEHELSKGSSRVFESAWTWQTRKSPPHLVDRRSAIAALTFAIQNQDEADQDEADGPDPGY